MKKKIIIKTLLWGAGICFMLFAVLVVHVAMVLPKTSDARVRQLSRIDFKQTIDSAQAAKIQAFVAGLEGVESTLFNIPDGILVYTYTVGKQTSANVYNSVMQQGNYDAAPYTVTEEQMKNSCPVNTNKKSMVYRLASYLSKYF